MIAYILRLLKWHFNTKFPSRAADSNDQSSSVDPDQPLLTDQFDREAHQRQITLDLHVGVAISLR